MIRELRSKIENGQFEFTQHAVDQTFIRHITIQEIREAFADSQITDPNAEMPHHALAQMQS